MKPRIAQLEQSGATDGQVATWSASAGVWVPSSPTSATATTAVPDSGGALVFPWGINAHGQGYYNASGVTAGQEAALNRDVTTGRYYLEAITP